MVVPAPSEEYIILAPDGGWGWVVVIASFYCQVVIDGIQLSFGMILVEMATYYGTTESAIALIGSLMFGFHYLAGPLCAALSRTFGERPVCALGSVMATSGLVSAYFRPPYPVLYLTVGIITGIGLCFINMNSIVTTTLYFKRKRIIALGIVVCGTGVGTMVFAVIANIILKDLQWQSVCLIEAALALSTLLAVLCFRPLKVTEIRAEDTVGPSELRTVYEEEDEEDVRDVEHKYYFFEDETPNSLGASRTSVNSLLMHTNQLLDEFAAAIANPNVEYEPMRCKLCRKCCRPPRPRHRSVIVMSPARKRQITRRRPFGRESNYSRQSTLSRCGGILGRFLGCDILKSFPFIIFSVNGAFSACAMITVFMYEKVRVLHDGASDDEAMIIMVALGAFNVFWRFSLSVLPNLPRVDYNVVNICGMLLGGIAIATSGLNHSNLFIHINGFISTFAIGCFAVYYPVILLDLAGVKKLSNATGITMMFMGFVCIVGPPLIGFFMRLSEDYDMPFYAAGTLFILAGMGYLIIYLVPSFRHIESLS